MGTLTFARTASTLGRPRASVAGVSPYVAVQAGVVLADLDVRPGRAARRAPSSRSSAGPPPGESARRRAGAAAREQAPIESRPSRRRRARPAARSRPDSGRPDSASECTVGSRGRSRTARLTGSASRRDGTGSDPDAEPRVAGATASAARGAIGRDDSRIVRPPRACTDRAAAGADVEHAAAAPRARTSSAASTTCSVSGRGTSTSVDDERTAVEPGRR